MDMSPASAHGCCKKPGLNATPPQCCASYGQVSLAAVSPKAPRAFIVPATPAPGTAIDPFPLMRRSTTEVATVALSPPVLLRI
jgi:hypothetical protein